MNFGVNNIAGSFVGSQQAAADRDATRRLERNKPKVTREIHDEFMPTSAVEKVNADRTLKGNVDEETREDRSGKASLDRRPSLDLRG